MNQQQQIENAIKAISGNAPVLEKLYALLNSGDAIAFVGAGASAGLWPLWDEFLKGFVDHSLKLGKITPPEADFFKKEAAKKPLVIAQQLRNKIQDRHYFEYLQETFGNKISPFTGGAFTLTHQALLQLPFHNYLTLNYDAGLTNARTAIYPHATTSYFFWDQEEARRIRERGYKRLVLHAHGRYDRADSIILTLDDYRKAYDHHPFVRLLNELLNSEKLILIGFGMTDPYIEQLFRNINKDKKTSPFQHIAFVGLDESELQVAHLHREQVEMVYGARVLFYPSANHHQALTDWLDMLVAKYSAAAGSRTAEESKAASAPPQLKVAIKDKYVHQPTDDDNYQGRAQDFATLNRWANDPATRMIAITGIGGQGKTAMTGRWLKHERHQNIKPMPVFYWSFYEDLDVQKFLEQVVEFCLPLVRLHGHGQIEPISFILRVVQQARLLLVLDGLEVLQEDAASPNHGKISHPLLQAFLQNWLRTPHQGLMLLTSRFHFPQLIRYSGVGFHQLDLLRLSTADGVALLKRLGLFGDDKLLASYVEKLSGHPLALRVLASAVKRSCFGNIDEFTLVVAPLGAGSLLDPDDLTPEGVTTNDLGEKLKRLLRFYEQQLQNGQKELMGILSLFKRPVETESFVTLLSKMKSLQNTALANADKATIEQQLKALVDDFLVEKTAEGMTTHPVIRDYFRAGQQLTGARVEVADFLKARPGAERPTTIAEARDLVEAMQLLCDEGEFKAAHDLRKARLGSGGYEFDVFKNLPAMAEGLECHLAFVGDEKRQQKLAKVLGKGDVAFHCSGVSYYNFTLGNLAQAIEWRYKVIELDKRLNVKKSQAFDLHEASLIEMVMGDISKAKETASQALNLSFETKNLSDLRSEFAYQAYYEFLLGHSGQAYQDFEIALFYDQKRWSEQQSLTSGLGNYQAEFLIRIQAWQQFEAVNAWNIQRCEINHWNDTLAICHLLQGWYEIRRGELSQAEKALKQAEHILRPSGMLREICRLDWVWALLAEAREDFQTGLRHVDEALLVCADKGFRLWQADHFVLRARLYLLQFQKENQADEDLVEKAGDDGDRALKIAADTGYVWAKVDALKLLTAYHQTRAQLPEYDTEQEKELAQRYAKEAAEIEKGLFLTEKQMQELKAQARKEFEQQTAGWDEDESD